MNPRSPASQASVLIQTRLRALSTGLGRKCNNENQIINTLLKLKASGLKDSTLKQINWILTRLSKNSDLAKPEEIRVYIANLKVANSIPDQPRAMHA